MIGASGFRRAPLLLLAAALLALGVFGLHGAQTADAQTTESNHYEADCSTTKCTYWAATLTAKDQGTPGCNNNAGVHKCSDPNILTSDSFTYDDVQYTFEFLYRSSTNVNILFDKQPSASLRAALTLRIGGDKQSPLVGNTVIANNKLLILTQTGATWSIDDKVSLALVGPITATTTTRTRTTTTATTTTTTTTTGTTTTINTTRRADRPRVSDSNGLSDLEIKADVQPAPASQRGPYCYLGRGSGATNDTEYVRYPDGSIRETTGTSAFIRTRFAC